MPERRIGTRHLVSFPIRVEWLGDDGETVFDEGLTENVGPNGTLIHLQRALPEVGASVTVTVTERPKSPVTVEGYVIRLERNAGHPQAALQITGDLEQWQAEVWEYAEKLLEAREAAKK